MDLDDIGMVGLCHHCFQSDRELAIKDGKILCTICFDFQKHIDEELD
jgi:hypothetical protein